MSGDWSGQAKGSTSCTTTNGACTVSKSNLKPGGSATLTITGIEAAGYTYVEGTTTVTVNAPQ